MRKGMAVQWTAVSTAASNMMSTATVSTDEYEDELLAGCQRLAQPHHLRPKVIDQLTGEHVEATNDALGAELPNVDLTMDFTMDDIAAIHKASDDAGGILVFSNQRPEMTVQQHVQFARKMQAYCDGLGHGAGIELSVAKPAYPEAPEILEIVREPTAHVTFGENWHSDHSFHEYTCSFSILRGVVTPRYGVNDTLFSSVADAFDALTPTMQNLLMDLKVYHSANRAYGIGHDGNSLAAMKRTNTMQLRDDLEITAYDVLHPMVVVHPTCGRKVGCIGHTLQLPSSKASLQQCLPLDSAGVECPTPCHAWPLTLGVWRTLGSPPQRAALPAQHLAPSLPCTSEDGSPLCSLSPPLCFRCVCLAAGDWHKTA